MNQSQFQKLIKNLVVKNKQINKIVFTKVKFLCDPVRLILNETRVPEGITFDLRENDLPSGEIKPQILELLSLRGIRLLL